MKLTIYNDYSVIPTIYRLTFELTTEDVLRFQTEARSDETWLVKELYAGTITDVLMSHGEMARVIERSIRKEADKIRADRA